MKRALTLLVALCTGAVYAATHSYSSQIDNTAVDLGWSATLDELSSMAYSATFSGASGSVVAQDVQNAGSTVTFKFVYGTNERGVTLSIGSNGNVHAVAFPAIESLTADTTAAKVTMTVKGAAPEGTLTFDGEIGKSFVDLGWSATITDTELKNGYNFTSGGVTATGLSTEYNAVYMYFGSSYVMLVAPGNKSWKAIVNKGDSIAGITATPKNAAGGTMDITTVWNYPTEAGANAAAEALRAANPDATVEVAVISAPSAVDENFDAVKAIVGRIAGGYNGSSATGLDAEAASTAMAKFEFVKVSASTVKAGEAIVDDHEGKIRIQASNAEGASFGLGQYLRHTAKMHISWCGNRTTTDFPLPSAVTTYKPTIPVRFAYNYCTISYTMAFWSEKEWREEIDRLALSGYNVALVLQGLQEAWRITLESVKKADGSRVYSNEQIMRYVSDEAAQAWWHMGNLEGLGGPLGGDKGDYSAADAYAKFTARCQKDAKLGEFIYAEMMKLGIQPSIQSFVGLVPDCSNQVLADGVANGQRFGDAANWDIINEGGWQGYTRPDVVNPLNIAFDEMSKAWYGALVSIYKPATHGYTSYMGGDLFHEGGNKGSLTDANLADIAVKIQNTQNEYFGKNGNVVTWVLQSWQGSPYQGIRNGLDCKKAIIQLLDKDMSTTGGVNANYWNNTTGEHIPWIWVEVLNFGGNTGMHGGARRFSNLAKIGTASGHSASFMGYGILSEGLETNPMMYDMFNDAFTRSVGTTSSLDTDEKMKSWIHDYLVRRYGESNVCKELEDAYAVLIKTVFDCSRYQEGCVENILCAGGSYSVDTVSKWGPKAGIEYDPIKVHEAARAYLAAVQKNPELKNLDTFKYDFVELFLQILGERGRVINADCATSAKKRAEFLGLLDLAEKITACSPRWRLDWHEERTKTVCPDLAGVRGYRRMVTSWADGYSAGQATGLREYAHRGYSGLFKDYYKKRWEWFFQVTDGTISQAKYVQNLTDLDATFPTAVLTPTPEGDMIAIANEIMEFLYPPALTWNGAADTTWAGNNWTDGGTGATVAWSDGMDVNITPADLTLTTAGQTTGDMTLVDGAVAIATGSGYITTTAAVVPRLTGVSLEDLASKYSLTATMNGGWVKAGTATGRCVKFNADKTELTVQFQMIDDGYLKDVIVIFAKDGENITAKATAAKNQQGGALGTDLSSTGGNASVATTDAAAGYGVKAIKLCRGKLMVNGPLTIGGTLYLGNNDLVFNGKTTITQVSVDAAAAKGALVLGDSPVSIASLTTDGTKLVIKGESNVLLGGKLTLAKADLAKAVYVGPDGVEQTLVKAADGSVKSAVTEKVVGKWIPKSVTSTGLYGVTLNELATRFVITGTMDGGFVPTSSVNAYCGTLADNKYTVQMQTVDGGYLKVVALEFTEVGGEIKVEAKWIRNRQGAALGTDCTDLPNSTNWGNPDVVTDTSSNGYGIYNLTLTPAVAMVGEVPYTTLSSAISAANDAMVTIISDMTTGAISTYPVKLEVAEGVELTVTAGDFLGWNKAWELHVKGTVNLGGNALSYGEATYTQQKIYIYEGGSMVNSSGHGFSVFEDSTIYVKHVEGKKDPALIDATLQARKNITIDVEAGAKAIVNANVMDKDGQSGIANPKIIKTGSGELIWNGYFQTSNVSLELNGGTFTHALANDEAFSLIVTNGTPKFTAESDDYKVEVSESENGIKIYRAVAKTYLVKVTNPGETGQNGAGKLFENYGDAADYAVELQTANPAILVIMWTVVDNRDGLTKDDTFTAALAAYNAAHSPDKTLDTITSKSPDGEQFDHELWDTSGIYKDQSTQNDILYPMNATEWTASVKGKTKATDGEDVVMTAEHTVIFNQNYGPIYINTAILPRSMKITDNATLKLGYWNGTCSLPSGMTVTVENGATAQFDNWANGWPVKVPNATINGEGSVVFGSTITGSSAVEIGTLSGTAALTLKNGVTVTVNNSIANTLKGTGTIKVMNLPATFSVAEDANVTFVDGTTHTAKEIMVKTVSGTTVTLTRGIAVAKVNGQVYANMADAVAAANADGYELFVYSTAEDIFETGYINIGTFDLTGITVKVILPDARYEATIPGAYAEGKVTFNPVVSAMSCAYDWTFNGAGTTGSKGRTETQVQINCDGSNNYQWATDGSMQSKCHPYYGISWNGEFTLATFLSAGTVADTVLVALGNTNNSLALIKDEGENMIKLVKIQSGTRSNVSGSILVPNLSQQHLYMITCSEAHDEIKLWIDGNLWETIPLDTALNLNDGFQVGSIYQGLAGGLRSESAAEPSVKMIRVFGNVLGKTCAEALKKQFKYVSQSGAYERTISTATANWVEEGEWTKIDSNPAETVAEPTEGSVPVLKVTCDTTITVNTSKPMTFEAMTIRSGDGSAHTVTFKFADDTTDAGRANKLMPAMALIESGITVITQYAAFETLGSRLRLENNAHLKFSYEGLNPWEVLGLSISGQVSSAIEMGEGSTVEVVKPDMTGLNGYVDFELIEEGGAYYVSVGRVPGASLEVTWDSSVTSWTDGAKGKITHDGKTYDVIIQEGDIVHFAGTNNAVDMGDGSAMPNVQLIVDAGARVTMTGRPNTSTINGDGTVAFTEKNLDLTSANISGTATLEIAADQTVNANTLSTPVKGSGKLVVTSLPDNLKTYLQNAANWTGTIVIKNVSGVRDLDLAKYGNASSTVELDGVSGFFANNEHSYSGTIVIGNGGLTITDGYSTYGVYKFAKLGGTGTISMTKGTVHHKFMIGDYSDFTGMIKTTGSPFTVGSTGENTDNGTIKVIAGGSLTAANLTQVDFANGKVGVETDVTVTGAFTKEIVLKSVLSTVTGRAGLDVTTSVEGKVVKTKVVEGNTIYGLVTDASPVTPSNPGSTIPVMPSTGTGTITITDSSSTPVEGNTIPMSTGVYTVKVVENGFEVASEEFAVIAAKEAEEGETPAKTTTAVAVAFDETTVATLLNNSLLSEGDTLTAYVNGAYWMWKLNGAGIWEGATMVRSGSAEGAPIASETSLARGTAVWVTTAGKIVTFGKYTEPTSVSMPTTEETHLLANPTMKTYTPPVESVENEDEITTIGETPEFFTKKNGVWKTRQDTGLTLPNGTPIKSYQPKNPSIPVGKAFWFIKK